MKKMRRGVALLLSVLLVWTPAGTVRADEATGAADVNGQIEIQENKVSEDEAQANEAQAEVLKSLYLGSEDKNGKNWMYTASDHTLKITGDVTVSGTAEKIIGATGDLNIMVASGAALTVESTMGENRRYAIYADGNITLGGEGIIDIKHEDQRDGIRAQKGITIRGITLNLLSGGSFPEIRANGGELVIEDAIVTAKGLCMAWNDGSSYYPVRILGRSVVDIESTNASGALRGGEYVFSDCAHVKVRDDKKMIGGANLAFKLAAGQTKNYYFRAKDGNLFTKGEMIRTNNDAYFEYIGANHVDKATPNAGQATHTMQCGCGTSIIASCSGGTATCTAQAVCEVCGQSYGDTLPHQYKEYHVCSECKGLEANADVVVAVVAGGEKHGYTSGEMGDAIAFAGKYPGAVLAIMNNIYIPHLKWGPRQSRSVT